MQHTQSKNISDNILIWQQISRHHNKSLEAVLQTIDHHGLIINHSNCIFGAGKITFAGRTLTADGIAPEKLRIQATQAISAPKNI